MNTPTKKSLELLRKEGYTVAITEHWNSFARIRQDLFGIIDLVGIRSDVYGVLGVQTTSFKNIGSRLKKAMDNPALLVWLKAGNRFEVWGTKKIKNKWVVKKRELVKHDLLPKRTLSTDEIPF